VEIHFTFACLPVTHDPSRKWRIGKNSRRDIAAINCGLHFADKPSTVKWREATTTNRVSGFSAKSQQLDCLDFLVVHFMTFIMLLCPLHTADATKLFCRVGVGGVNSICN